MSTGASIAPRPEAGGHLFDPVVENRPSSRPPGAPIRVVAFNAQGATKVDGILACLRTPHLSQGTFFLLSEVDCETYRSGRRMVAAELARELGMSFAYIGEWGLCGEDGAIRCYLGNAILSREPLEDVTPIPMPDPHGWQQRALPFGMRGSGLRRKGGPVAMAAMVSVGGSRLRLCVAHLDSRCAPAGREAQMAALLDAFPPGPGVIGGDFNTTTMSLMDPKAATEVMRRMLLEPRRFRHPVRYEPLFERMRQAGFEIDSANAEGVPSFTFSRVIPPWMRPRLDWIALRGIAAVAASASVIPARPGFFAKRVSDHDFVVVDLDLG